MIETLCPCEIRDPDLGDGEVSSPVGCDAVSTDKHQSFGKT
jgi:hypothetical protein